MDDKTLLPLHHAADGELLFHTGRWGAPPGYRWRGPDGDEAGQVPFWEADELDRLRELGLIAVEARRGPAHRRVTATPRGMALLHRVA